MLNIQEELLCIEAPELFLLTTFSTCLQWGFFFPIEFNLI